jgi:hypothetical protein
MSNNRHLTRHTCYVKRDIRGFAPNPTSFFVLTQRTKQEKSSLPAPRLRQAGQNDLQRALLQGRNFKQSWQASLLKFHA